MQRPGVASAGALSFTNPTPPKPATQSSDDKTKHEKRALAHR